jgi:NAD(P)-dependent dehydrogenase (short-subunit alcohol dehydrogenase family)
MARVFITGSADGLGQMSAKLLIEQGHQVVLHARNADRAKDALVKTPEAEQVLVGDLSNLEETKKLADQVNQLARFDAIIHNAGVYQTSAKQIVAVNTLAPYVLTCLIQKPKRLIYLSSGMHLHGSSNLESLKTNVDRISYSDSKLHVMMLALIVARRWTDVYSNAVDPGWVPTKMGGRNAPDDLQKGFETQSWLAVSDDERAKVSGRYFFNKREKACNPIANDKAQQENLVVLLGEMSGVQFPV